MFAKFDLSVVYVPGKDNTVANCLSCWADPAGKAGIDISSHEDAEKAEEGRRIIEVEKAMEEDDTKCFVVIASKAELRQRRDAGVRVLMEEALEESLMARIEYVELVLMQDWPEDCVSSEQWNKYWNAVSDPSDDEWPKGLTEDGDKLILNDKLFVRVIWVEAPMDDWHNPHPMLPGRNKMQRDLQCRFEFPPGYYAILNRYSNDCAMYRAIKCQNTSTAMISVYTAIPEAPMRSIAMDVFAMPEVTVEGEKYDCTISAVDRHSGYIVSVPGKKLKTKDKTNKHGVGLQAKAAARAVITHWLTILDAPAAICSNRGSQLSGSWF